LHNRVAQATASTMAQLARLGFTGIRPPSGGYYVWCPLPGGDDLELSRRAAAQGIFIAPSTIFSVDAVGYTPAMRVNIAYADHPKFLDFLSRQREG
jgi:DNA-binding transcriptional MocR family regulator